MTDGTHAHLSYAYTHYASIYLSIYLAAHSGQGERAGLPRLERFAIHKYVWRHDCQIIQQNVRTAETQRSLFLCKENTEDTPVLAS